MRHTPAKVRAMTLVEILIVIALMSILAMLSLQAFYSVLSSKSLESETARVVAELQRARALTLASKYSSAYGIHLATTSITLFQGTGYISASATNTLSTLSSSVKLAYTLAGGGSDIIFQRLTGESTTTGLITLSLANKASTTKSITVYQTGLLDVH